MLVDYILTLISDRKGSEVQRLRKRSTKNWPRDQKVLLSNAAELQRIAWEFGVDIEVCDSKKEVQADHIEVLSAIIDCIHPAGNLSYQFRDGFFHDKVGEIIDNGHKNISIADWTERKERAKRILLRGIETLEDAYLIEGVIAYGRMNGFDRAIKAVNIKSELTFLDDDDVRFTKKITHDIPTQ